MDREQEIREEILSKVGELYRLREDGSAFVPGKTRIHYAGRVYDEREMQAVVNSALDFHLTLGKEGQAFAAAFAQYMGARHALAVNSGSSANLLAIGALCSRHIPRPLAPGDEVITTALTFPTTLNPILQYGLVPVFADVEKGSYNIDPGLLEQALSEKTRAIVFAHTLGNPARMDAIMAFAKAHGLYVIEDTCDALDSRYDGRLCGTFGDMATFSFYAAHHITMGEGGAVVTNDTDLYRQALSLRDWGRACYCKTGEANPLGACGRRFSHTYEGLPDGYDHKYVYSNIGYNLKPLDIQCAMGLEQLKKLPAFSRKRKENFAALYAALQKHEAHFILPRSLDNADPSWFCFPLTVREGAPFSRHDIVTYLENRQIETRMLFAGNILRHPGYQNIARRIAGELPNTENILRNTFFIGVYPGLTQEMLSYMAEAIDAFMAGVTAREAPKAGEPMREDLTEARRPAVSVVLLAYNHLDYTKKCVESLYRYTADVDFELITVNNGSSDGTEGFFNSLPNAKKISFPQNVGVDKAVNAGFRIAEGKYTLNLSNDIVVTARWLSNLVKCAESDERIAMVVPVCGFSSNNQQVSLPYTTLEEMQRLAAAYNQSNPALWEERLRLITYTCLFRTDVQKAIGGFDEDFNPGAYDDDAISFRIRRMGYKLILARDTFVHHFGSVTFREEYKKNNLATRNKALFIEKFGVDPWGATKIDQNVVALGEYDRKGGIRILGVGSSSAASLLQIKNEYRSRGERNVTLDYLSENKNTLDDLATVCRACFLAEPNEVKKYFGEQSYDLIVVESETNKLRDLGNFYKDLCGMLREDGRLVTTAVEELLPLIDWILRENGLVLAQNISRYYFAFNRKPAVCPP